MRGQYHEFLRVHSKINDVFFYTCLIRSIGVFQLEGSVAGEIVIALVTGIAFTTLFDEFRLLTKSTFYFNCCFLISQKKW